MKLAQRLMPRSITSQITFIVAVSVLLAVALLASVLILFIGPPANDNRAAIARIAEISRLARNASTPSERDAIISTAQRLDPQIRRVAIGELVPINDNNGSLVPWLVERALTNQPDVELIADLRDPNGPESQVVMRLAGSEAMVFELRVDSPLWRMLLAPAALMATIIVVSTVLLSLYAVRWVVTPLAKVADAAASFGQTSLASEALARRGPQEIIQVTDALNDMRTRIRD